MPIAKRCPECKDITPGLITKDYTKFGEDGEIEFCTEFKTCTNAFHDSLIQNLNELFYKEDK